MKSELSGIFRVKLVTKNIVRESPGTQFMHMRVKRLRWTAFYFCKEKEKHLNSSQIIYLASSPLQHQRIMDI